MYELYYGLRERPFDLSPNARFLFLSKKHREALTHIEYALRGRPGITVLVGEAGTGKTTLIRAALQSHPSAAQTLVHVANPTLTRTEFYEHLAEALALSSEAARSKTVFLRELQQALAVRPVNGVGFAIVVDEAQSLPDELLEEIRLLTNVESAANRSLGIVIAGQPELAARLNEPSLRQLKQRVTLRCELGVLDLAECAAYISVRIKVAGGQPEQVFSRDAVMAIHHYSAGIPRTINVICDNALINGFATGAMPVGPDLILEVRRDFQIAAPASTPVSTVEPAHADSSAAATHDEAAPAFSPALDSPRKAQPLFSGFSKPRRFFQFTR